MINNQSWSVSSVLCIERSGYFIFFVFTAYQLFLCYLKHILNYVENIALIIFTKIFYLNFQIKLLFNL